MSKLFIKRVSKRVSRDALSFGGHKLGTLIRIITGHNALNYFKNKINNEINGECRFCMEDDETFWHLVTDCPVFIQERRDILLGTDVRDKWDVAKLMEMAGVYKIEMALLGNEGIYYESTDENESYERPDPEPD